jgi:hypothetical protein
MNTVMSLKFNKGGEFLDRLDDYQLLKEYSAPLSQRKLHWPMHPDSYYP